MAQLGVSQHSPVVTQHDGTERMEPNTEPTAANITAGLATRQQLASDLRCSERTIIRREHQGLPVIRLGIAAALQPVSRP